MLSALAFRYYAHRRYYFLIWFPFFSIISALLYLQAEFIHFWSAAIGFVLFSCFHLGAYEYRKLKHHYYAFRPSNTLFFLSSLIFSGINALLQSLGALAFLLAGSALSGNELLLPFVFLLSLFAYSLASLLTLIARIFGSLKTYFLVFVLGAAFCAFTNKEAAVLSAIGAFFEKNLFLRTFPFLLMGSAICFLIVYTISHQTKK